MIHATSERLLGYARVSTNEQELDLQTDALLRDKLADHEERLAALEPTY